MSSTCRVFGRHWALPRTAPTSVSGWTRPRSVPVICWRRCRRLAGTRTASTISPTIRRWPASWLLRPARWCQAGRYGRGDRSAAARPGRPLYRRRTFRVAAARPGQRPAHRAQLLLGRPEGDAVAVGLGNRCGDGGFAADPLPRRLRNLAPLGRPLGMGTSAMRTSGDDIAEILALLGVRPVWDEASRRVTGVEVIPLAELGRPRIDVTVRISGFFRDAFRMWSPCSTTPSGWRPASTSPPTRITCAPTSRPISTSTVTNDGPPQDLRLKAGHLRRRSAAADRQPQLARRRRSGGGVHRLGRFRLRPRSGRPAGRRGHAPAISPDHGRRQEHRLPRARHRRLRRLLPVPRRHGRHRPRADRRGPGGLHRRQHPTEAVRTRTLSEETTRVFRSRVVNPDGWPRCAATGIRGPSRWPPRWTICSATTPPPG